MKKLIEKLFIGDPDQPDLVIDALRERTWFKHTLDVVVTKYFELMQMNVILLLFSLPLFVWTIIVLGQIPASVSNTSVISYYLLFLVGFIPGMMILSLALGSIAKLMTLLLAEDSILLWSDFFKYLKSYGKRSLKLMFTCSLCFVLGQLAWLGYNLMIGSDFNYWILSIKMILLVVHIVWILIGCVAFFLLGKTDDSTLKLLKRASLLVIIHITKLLGVLCFVLLPMILLIGLGLIVPKVSHYLVNIYVLVIGIVLTLLGIWNKIDKLIKENSIV